MIDDECALHPGFAALEHCLPDALRNARADRPLAPGPPHTGRDPDVVEKEGHHAARPQLPQPARGNDLG